MLNHLLNINKMTHRKLFLLLLCLSINSQINAQLTKFPCGSTAFLEQFDDWSGINPSYNYEQNIINTIKKKTNDLSYLTLDNTKLQEVKTVIRQDTFIEFKHRENTIKVTFDERHVRQFATVSDNHIYPPSYYEEVNTVFDSTDKIDIDTTYDFLAVKDLYGFRGTINDSLKGIKSIALQRENSSDIVIPIELYDDLMNPNIYDRYKSYRPTEVFYDKSKKAYYVYICGKIEINKDVNELDKSIFRSYVAKIIIDTKKNTFTRYIVHSETILPYGWFFCDNFWVF
jgi:hypothetical protein